jgi:hypothetical protein
MLMMFGMGGLMLFCGLVRYAMLVDKADWGLCGLLS